MRWGETNVFQWRISCPLSKDVVRSGETADLIRHMYVQMVKRFIQGDTFGVIWSNDGRYVGNSRDWFGRAMVSKKNCWVMGFFRLVDVKKLWWDGALRWLDVKKLWCDGVLMCLDVKMLWCDGVLMCLDVKKLWWDGVLMCLDVKKLWCDGVFMCLDEKKLSSDGVLR